MDPFERAAQVARRAAQGKRKEGMTTKAVEALGKALWMDAVRMGTLPKRMVEAAANDQMPPVSDSDYRQGLKDVAGEFTGSAAMTMLGPRGGGAQHSAKVVPGVDNINAQEVYEKLQKLAGKPSAWKNLESALNEKPEWTKVYTGANNLQSAATKKELVDQYKNSPNWQGKLGESVAKGERDLDWAAINAEHAISQTARDFKNKWRSPTKPSGLTWFNNKAFVPPEAERQFLREQAGFTTPAYRGVSQEGRRSFDKGEQVFSTAEPKLADMYAMEYRQGNSNVQPLMLNTKDYHVHDAQGGGWSAAQDVAFPEAARKGSPGVTFLNVLDEPHSTNKLGPQTVYVTMDPTTRKSAHARMFDPTSPDILTAKTMGDSPVPLTGGLLEDEEMNAGGKINRAMRTAQRYARGGLINSSVPGRTDKHPMKVPAGSYVLPADVVSGLGENNTMAGAERLKKIFNANEGPFGSGQPKLKTPRISTGKMKGTQMSARTIRQRFADGGSPDPWRAPQLSRGALEQQRALSKMAPNGIPWREWRQSENVEDRRPGGEEYDPFAERFPEYKTAHVEGDPVDIIVAGGEYLIDPSIVERIGGGDPEKGYKVLDQFVKLVRSKNVKTLKGLPPPKK